MGKSTKRALILLLAISTVAAAREKKPKPQPGPYIFTIKASAQTLKAVIVQANLSQGYKLDSDDQLQFRFSKPGQLPFMDQMVVITGICKGLATRTVWSYSLVELNGTTKVSIQPVWEYPDEDCQVQTRQFIWDQPEEMAAFQAMLEKAATSTAQAEQQAIKQHAACVELAKDNPSITCK
jgi:hypothetical protein